MQTVEELTLDEVIERHGLNGEMGAVGELLRREGVMDNEPFFRPPEESQAHVRRLVADYTANGAEALPGMTGIDLVLLLSAKQLHLGLVVDRCDQGEGLHVNVPLKRILEKQVKEIDRSLKAKDSRGPER